MATVFTPKRKDEKNVAPQFGTEVGGVSSTGIDQPKSRGSQATGSFINLQKLLGANVGAGTQMVGRVGQMGQQKAAQVGQLQQQALAPAQKVVESEQAAQARAKEIGEAVSQVKSGEQLGGVLSQYGYPIGKLATGDTSQLQRVGKELQTTSTQAAGALEKLKGIQTGLGTETGRAGLLAQLYKAPTYGGGMSALDQALMQTSKNLLQTQMGLAKQAQEAKSKQEQLGQVQQELGGLQTGAQTIKEQLQKQLTGAGETAEKALETTAAERTKAAQDERDAIIERFKKGESTAEDYAKLGLGAGQTLYGLELTPEKVAQILQKSEYGKGDVATAADVQAFKALKDILGVAPEYKVPTEQKESVFVSPEQKASMAQTLADMQAQFEAQLPTQFTQGFGWTSEDRDIGGKKLKGKSSLSMTLGDYLKLKDAAIKQGVLQTATPQNIIDKSYGDQVQEALNKLGTYGPDIGIGPGDLAVAGPRDVMTLVKSLTGAADKAGTSGTYQYYRDIAQKQLIQQMEDALQKAGYYRRTPTFAGSTVPTITAPAGVTRPKGPTGSIKG